MKIHRRDPRVGIMIPAALALLLFIALQGSGPSGTPVHLDGHSLVLAKGRGFWTDPCTLDGYSVGAGSVLCGTGSVGGCVTAFFGLMKAIYADSCFS